MSGFARTSLDAATIAFMLDHCEAKVLITDREFSPTVKAALALANGNRTAAAEILGLSRQSLYAKLNRYGLEGDADAVPVESD
jgi:DNA-binding NtrC family response regulator